MAEDPDRITLRAAVQNSWPSMDMPCACKAIRAGEIAHNAKVARNPGKRNVTPSCVLSWKGEERRLPPPLFVAFNKPVGYAATMPGNGEPSVYDVFPHPNKNLRTIGRLDKDTSGLLLFTTHGRWGLELMSPESNSPKLYRCWLRDPATDDDLRCFLDGTAEFKDTKRAHGISIAKPALLAAPVSAGDMACIDLCISEGKYHQVRLMWRARGNHVERLHRLSFGTVELGDLGPGECRELTDTEVAQIRLKMENKLVLPPVQHHVH
jgi:16S rRNA pseudouridine516 synthase